MERNEKLERILGIYFSNSSFDFFLDLVLAFLSVTKFMYVRIIVTNMLKGDLGCRKGLGER